MGDLILNLHHFADLSTDVQNSELFTILIQIAAYITPYFLIPATFKFGLGVFGNLAGMINDRSRGFFDRNRKFRANQMAKKRQDHMEGKSWLGTGRTGRAYRRVGTGNFGLTARQRRNFGANEAAITARAAEEGLKRDNGRAFADDDATAAAIHATSSRDFIQRYVDVENARRVSAGKAALNTEEVNTRIARAKEALGDLEIGLGGKIGSSTMKVAAYRARAASSKGYAPGREGLKELYDDGVALSKAGIMTDGDVAQAIKSNKSRADQSGLGYGDVFAGIAKAKSVSGLTLDDAGELHLKALDGARPGEIVGGHTDTIKALAPAMLKRLENELNREGGPDMIEVNRQLAEIAGRYDAMAQISPNSAREMAKGVLGMPAGTTGTTVQHLIEQARNNPDFVNMRREYGRSEMTAAAAEAAARSGGDPTQQPPPLIS